MNEYRVPELNVQNGVLKVNRTPLIYSSRAVLKYVYPTFTMNDRGEGVLQSGGTSRYFVHYGTLLAR